MSRKYRKEKAALSTYLYHSINWCVQSYCLSRRQRPTVDIDDHPHKASDPSWLERFLQGLSEEARELVTIVCEPPEELADLFWADSWSDNPDLGPKPRRAPVAQRRALREFMIEELGWESELLDRVWQEVQECLEES